MLFNCIIAETLGKRNKKLVKNCRNGEKEKIFLASVIMDKYNIYGFFITRNLTACPALHLIAAHSINKEETFIPQTRGAAVWRPVVMREVCTPARAHWTEVVCPESEVWQL